MKMFKNKYSGFLFLLLCSFNCSNHSHNDAGQIQITYWCANNQYEINLAKAIVSEWNQLHPDIPVRYQPVPEGESSEEMILAAVVGKTTPDIYSNMWAGDVEFYVRANKLLQLDQFSDFDSVAAERFSDDVIEQMRSPDGGVYQLLWKTNPILMIYNKTIFEEAGYSSFPSSYSEFLQAADKISIDRDGNGHNDRWIGVTDIRARWRDRLFDFYPFYISASGGKTFLKKGRLAVDKKAAIKVFSFFQSCFKNDYFPYLVPSGSHDVFLYGDVASRITGPWEITHAEKLKPEGFRYDFSSLPVPDNQNGPSYTYADPKSIVIFSTTKFPKESWKFAQFLIRKQSDFYLLDLTSQLPYRRGILSDTLFKSYFKKNPLMIRFAEQANYTRATDSTPVLKELFDAISQEFEACVLYQAKTPEKAVEDMINRMKLVLQ